MGRLNSISGHEPYMELLGVWRASVQQCACSLNQHQHIDSIYARVPYHTD